MNNNFQDFDLIQFLQDYHIGYSETGKNIGRDWIGIEECPYCGALNNHLGININSKAFKCHVCGKKGWLLKFICIQLKVSFDQAKSIAKRYLTEPREIPYRERGKKVTFPKPMTLDMPKMAKQYLKRRGFNPQYLQEEYNLQFTTDSSYLTAGDTSSNFSYRIIIPIMMNYELVSYTARDYTEQREPRYRNPLIDTCVIPPASAIYNYDSLKQRGKAIIVEGIFDAWKLGGETVSVNGKVVTKEQVRYLSEKRLEKAFVLFDDEKEDLKQAEDFANSLSGVVDNVEIVFLNSGGDPGELSSEEAIKVRMELLR